MHHVLYFPVAQCSKWLLQLVLVQFLCMFFFPFLVNALTGTDAILRQVISSHFGALIFALQLP